jgi:hypothetical protein
LSHAKFSFEVRIAGSNKDLEAACRVRSVAYGRHAPTLQAQLSHPELLDSAPGVVILVCLEKVSGRPIGTARVQSNAYGPLLIERSIAIPADIANESRAEITRLSVIPGGDPQAKLALFKGVYLCCLAMQIRWMVVGARSDALRDQYTRLGFGPLINGDKSSRKVPLVHTGNLPHHVLRFDVTSAERNWHEQGNALYRFMFRTFHPDIHLFAKAPLSLAAADPSLLERDGETAPYAETATLSAEPALASSAGSQSVTILDKSTSLKGLARTASMPAAKQA